MKDRRFERLAWPSVPAAASPIRYLRRCNPMTKTQPVAGHRRAAQAPPRRPARILARGPLDGSINIVDAVTVRGGRRRVISPGAGFARPDPFPFVINGFHADNGSEYINRQVAKLLHNLHIGVHQIWWRAKTPRWCYLGHTTSRATTRRWSTPSLRTRCRRSSTTIGPAIPDKTDEKGRVRKVPLSPPRILNSTDSRWPSAWPKPSHTAIIRPERRATASVDEGTALPDGPLAMAIPDRGHPGTSVLLEGVCVSASGRLRY